MMEPDASQMEPDAEAREVELHYEDALLLVGEFQELIDELEEAEDASDEQQEHAEDLLDRLLSSLDELPLSSEMARERLANVQSWARLLVSEDEPEEVGPGSIYMLLRDELAELRGLLEYEMNT